MIKDKIVAALLEAKSVAIYTHINTDCDAVGSSLALREALMQLGKTADVFVHSNFPHNFGFYGDLSFYNKKTAPSYDICVCLDTATESRLGKFKFFYRRRVKTTIAIDHHVLSNEKFCKLNYVMDASSTCEILYGILLDLKVNITQTMCRNLISGIVTDTGKFTHSVTGNTFSIMAKLLETGGFKMEEITEPILNSMKMETFDMLKKAYSDIEFYCGGKLGVIMFRHEDFVARNASIDDMNAFAEIPLQVEVVKFAILASQDDKGYFRVSLRSKNGYSAKSVAEALGGGGHINASGCKLFGEYDEVKQRLIDTVVQTLGWSR